MKVFQVEIKTGEDHADTEIDCIWIATDREILVTESSYVLSVKEIEIDGSSPGVDLIIQ